MKISFRAFTITAIATGLMTLRLAAQTPPAVVAPVVPAVTNVPAAAVIAPVSAAPKTNAPAKPKAPAKKVVAKKAAPKAVVKAEAPPEPVLNPESATAKQDNINVRGQASMGSEVITHLKKGEPVTVLESVSMKKPKADEPAHWYRIALPPHVSVWVHSSYVDTNTATIKARKLNLRGGPGENYSVVGRLQKGDTVKPIDAKGEWLKIATPTNAFGFVASHLLERAPMTIAAVPVVPVTTKPEIAAVPVTSETVPTNTTPVVGETAPVQPVTAPVPPVTTPPLVAPVVEAPIVKVKKIVSREGFLKGSVSIQAPSYFELRALDTGKAINYVFSSSTNLVLKQYKGQRVVVTGEELLDERWQHTPVIIVDAIELVP